MYKSVGEAFVFKELRKNQELVLSSSSYLLKLATLSNFLA